MARRLDELIAAVRALGQGQQALLQELRHLNEEIRALRADLRAAAVPPTPTPAAEPPVPEPGPAIAPVAPPPQPIPRRRKRRFAWRPAGLLRWRPADLLARLPASLREAPGSLLERTWLLVVVVGLVVAGASELNLLQPVEVLAEYPKEWVRADWSRREAVSHIVAIAVDDESIERLGRWGPEWRARHGRLLRNLADDGAKAVGFDFYFKTPNTQYDPAFEEGIRYARARGAGVVVGMEYDGRGDRLVEPASPLREAVTAFSSTYLHKDRITNLVRYVTMFQPSATGDDTVRLVPAFSVAVALAGGRRAEEFPRYRKGIVPIDFAGTASVFPTVSYADAHDGRFAPGTFRGKFVMIGAFFAASRDFFDTPVQSEMPGVLIHANALYTLLRGVSRPLGQPWNALVLLGVAGLTGVICGTFRRTPRVLLVVVFVAAYWGLAIGLGLMREPLGLEVVPATVTVALMWTGVALREKVVAMRELRRTLGLPEEAVRRLEQDRTFQRGTLAKRMTVLASDVKNYSAFSREHPPTHVRQIMTEYQQMVERIIYRHGGYVNKFIGDAVIAIFGYPMDEERTAVRCVLAAKETQEGLRALTMKWKREGRPGIEEIRIGINTGVVNVSYLGSSKKQLDVLGATIDLAARLESASGEFGCLALLGPDTYAEVKPLILSRTVPVILKNRPDVTEAYTLDGLTDEPAAVTARAARR